MRGGHDAMGSTARESEGYFLELLQDAGLTPLWKEALAERYERDGAEDGGSDGGK